MPAATVALPQPRVPARLLLLAAAFLALTLTTVISLIGAPSASAHDQLLSSEPADGQTVEAPEAILLTFASAPLEAGAQIVVTGPDGAPVAAEAPAVDAAGASVKAALPADLAGGGYTVAWHVVSGDGHPIEGTFGFTVTAPSPAVSATQAAADEGSTDATDATDTPGASATASDGEAGAEVAGGAEGAQVPTPGLPDGATTPWVLALALLGALAAVIVSVFALRRKIMANDELREAGRRSAAAGEPGTEPGAEPGTESGAEPGDGDPSPKP